MRARERKWRGEAERYEGTFAAEYVIPKRSRTLSGFGLAARDSSARRPSRGGKTEGRARAARQNNDNCKSTRPSRTHEAAHTVSGRDSRACSCSRALRAATDGQGLRSHAKVTANYFDDILVGALRSELRRKSNDRRRAYIACVRMCACHRVVFATVNVRAEAIRGTDFSSERRSPRSLSIGVAESDLKTRRSNANQDTISDARTTMAKKSRDLRAGPARER